VRLVLRERTLLVWLNMGMRSRRHTKKKALGERTVSERAGPDDPHAIRVRARGTLNKMAKALRHPPRGKSV
jgi:hypothetical protein